MNEFLENTLDKPFTFSLLPTDGGGPRSTVTIMSKYIPVEMQLLKRESITNTGTIRVDLLDGKGLPSADRNGKSDPYCVFELNGDRVYKSEICKKTLAPVWNEKFEMHVPSREKAEFGVEVYDWDRVGEFLFPSTLPGPKLTARCRCAGTPDKLGRALINVDEGIEPFQAVERVVPLRDFRDASKPAGEIRIRMVFTPQYLHRSRKATSTFSAAGRIGSTLGGGVVNVGGGVLQAGEFVGKAGVGAVGTVGKAGFGAVESVGKVGVGAVGTVGKAGISGVGSVGKSVFGVGRLLTSRRDSSAPSESIDFATSDGGAATPTAAPNGAFAYPEGEGGFEILANGAGAGAGMGAPAGEMAGPHGAGALTVTLGDLTDGGEAGEKRAIVVKFNGGKTLLETHSHKGSGDGDHNNVISFAGESVTIKTPLEPVGGSAGAPADLQLSVVHKKAIGSDKVLASATVPVWQHISPTSPTATLPVALGGAHPGQLTVSLSVSLSQASSFRLFLRRADPRTIPHLQWAPTFDFLSHSPSHSTLDPDQHSIAGGSMTGGSPSMKRSRFSTSRFGRHHKEASPAPGAA